MTVEQLRSLLLTREYLEKDAEVRVLLDDKEFDVVLLNSSPEGFELGLVVA